MALRQARLCFVPLLFAAVLCAPGCAHRGAVGTPSIAAPGARDRIIVGTTTRDSVRRMFGAPAQAFPYEGGELWCYTYGATQMDGVGNYETSTASLNVKFNADGVVEYVGDGKTVSVNGQPIPVK